MGSDPQGQTLPSVPAFASAPEFTGSVVVLQGEQTQSECKKLAANARAVFHS